MDLISKDSLGREWQLSTIQLDLIMPGRFNLKYTDSDGKEKTPVMIHRAIIGSPERFLGVLIEHYAGAFPVWLSPEQVWIIPISEKHNKYCEGIYQKLKKENIRVEFKNANDTMGKKIREAEMQKIPYALIVGDKEKKAKSVGVRDRKTGKTKMQKLDKFIEKLKKEIKTKK
jgi:threonyl-tRNA synthetase